MNEENEEIEEDFDLSIEPSVWGPRSLTFFGPQSRAILITGEINQELAAAITSQLMALNSNSQDNPIYCYINSQGGDVYSAFAIFDIMRHIKAPVITVAMGQCMSAALLLLQGGDLRLALPLTQFMYHEVIMSVAVNSSSSLSTATTNYVLYNETIKDIVKKRSKLSETRWKKNFPQGADVYFGIDFAKQHQLIDAVLESEKGTYKFKIEGKNGK